MNKEIILIGVVSLVVGVLIAPIFTPVMPWGGQTMYRSMMGNNQIVGQIDSHFIEQMIPHHEDAIIMANLASTQAEHSEIKTLSADIIKAQSEEIRQMKEWYKDWLGVEVSDLNISMGHGMGAMMHGGMMGNETDIEALENTKPFDKEFIEQMIPHHQMAVMMAQMLLSATNKSEMKKLAENIISAQTKEINQMRDWYNTWY